MSWQVREAGESQESLPPFSDLLCLRGQCLGRWIWKLASRSILGEIGLHTLVQGHDVFSVD